MLAQHPITVLNLPPDIALIIFFIHACQHKLGTTTSHILDHARLHVGFIANIEPFGWDDHAGGGPGLGLPTFDNLGRIGRNFKNLPHKDEVFIRQVIELHKVCD